MSEHYKLQAEHGTWINLDADTHVLQATQSRLQDLIARATVDLTVITDEIVSRRLTEQDNSDSINRGEY